MFMVHFNASAAAAICLSEFLALLEREGVDPAGVYDHNTALEQFPFVLAQFADVATATRVLRTAVQVRNYYTLWTQSPWCASLHDAANEVLSAPAEIVNPVFDASKSWRLFITGERGKLPQACHAAIREHLGGAIKFHGKVDLSDAADTTLAVIIDFQPPASAKLAAQSSASASSSSTSLSFDPNLCAASGLCNHKAHDSGTVAAAAAAPSASKPQRPYRVFIGVRHETSRHLVADMALPKRSYIGPTSLDPELALTMANLGHVAKGSAVFDPFVGTGSLALAAAELGGVTWGTDIDYRVVVLGKRGRDVRSNFDQRGLKHPELIRCDNSIPALCPGGPNRGVGSSSDSSSSDSDTSANTRDPRAHLTQLGRGGVPFFDAVVTDPPYGVRAGARKSGVKPSSASNTDQKAVGATSLAAETDASDGNAAVTASAAASNDGVAADAAEKAASSGPHFPPTQVYDGEEVVIDLLDTAARLLVKGGRLVYLYPCVVDEYSRSQLPTHPCLTTIADPEERLSRMLARRIVVMVKTADYDITKSAEYKATSVAAATAAGTLGAGNSLKERLGKAYDDWFESKKDEKEALKSSIDAIRSQRKAALAAGKAAPGEAAPSSAVDTSAVAAPAAASNDVDVSMGGTGSSEAGSDAGGQLSRKGMKFELRKLQKQEERRKRLAETAALAASGLPVPTKKDRPLRVGAIANLKRQERIASGELTVGVGQAPFMSREEPPA